MLLSPSSFYFPCPNTLLSACSEHPERASRGQVSHLIHIYNVEQQMGLQLLSIFNHYVSCRIWEDTQF
jgi:hypothetical protein